MLQQQQPWVPHLLLLVGRPSQAFEQDSEEGWVVLWAVIAFTALLAEALIEQGAHSPLKAGLQRCPEGSRIL